MTPRRRWWLAGTSLAYLAGLAVLLLWPSGRAVRRLNLDLYLFFLHRGVSPALTPEHYAFALNILIFVPPVLVAGLVIEQVSPWWWAWGGTLASAAIELTQGLALPTRVPSWADVLANSLGALLGAALAVALRRRSHPPGRSEPTPGRAVTR